MTTFKKGDEVLLKMRVSERASNGQMIWTTVSKEGSESIFLINEDDLIPASALDVNKELLAENEQLRKALRLAGDKVEPLASFQQKDIGSSTIRVGEETKFSRDARNFNGKKG